MNITMPLVLAVALFMEQMDSTVIATSLPAIAADINTSPVALKLALTSYLVALAMFIPLSGWVADRYGANRTFKWAIVLFVAGSVGCASADSLGSFVVWRFLQGMGGAMMSPVARLILVRRTPRDRLVSAMAWLTIPAMVGPLVGPPIGGFITTFFSWHWIFLINAPIGLAGLLLANRFLEPSGYRNYRSLDLLGLILVSICFSGVVFGISIISIDEFPRELGLAAIVAGAISGGLYISWARVSENPLLQLKMFRKPSFRAAVLGGSTFRIAVGASIFILPLMLQLGLGMTPFEAGSVIFVGAIGAITVKASISYILPVVGYKRMMIASALLTGVTFAINGTFSTSTPVWIMMLVLLLSGFIRSSFLTANATVAYIETTKEEIGDATAMLASFQQITLALGVAVAGLVLEFSSGLRGSEIRLEDFHVAFYVIAGFAAVAGIWYAKFDKDTGADMSGRVSETANK